jgi:glycosyltransferase involved in cell wall biosynthesis
MRGDAGIELSVIIPTHNPHAGRLERTLAGLRGQSLATERWELIVVDNASPHPVAEGFDVTWHPHGRVVREETLGLTPARLRGFAEARAEACVLVDDDNVLDGDYLTNAVEALRTNPRVGAFGGKSLPEYEVALPEWFEEVHGPLAIADHGDSPRVVTAAEFAATREFPAIAPVGAGMCLRTEVARSWCRQTQGDALRSSLDRKGTSLVSAGDNDIVLTVLHEGWDVGYFPQLSLTHIMPAGRLTKEYHARLLEASNRSWVVMLGLHGISPWSPIHPWTLWLRKLRAAVRFRAWAGTSAFLKWKAACGQLAGRSDLWQAGLGRRREGERRRVRRQGASATATT